MSTSSSQLLADVAQLHTDSGLLHQVVHGPAKGPGSVVSTEGGAVVTAAAAIATVQDTADSAIAQVGRETADSIAQIQALANAQGYQVPVPYAAGINLTVANQTVAYNGQTYAPIVSALPFTTSGTFEAGKFRLIQGVSAADLVSPGGASLVCYSPAENPSAAIIVKKALDDTVDLRTKFGLTGDMNDDQTGAFNNLIEYINSLGSFGGTARVHGCYHITGALQNIKNGFRLKGDGFSRSRLFFDGVTGLLFDLAGQNGTPGYPILEDIALTTNGTYANGFSAVRVLPWTTVSNVDPGMTRTFQSTRVLTCSEAIWGGVPQTSGLNQSEWATHYKLGQTGSVINLNDCHIDDCIFGGSYLNMAPTTQTGAIGIDGSDVTGLRIMRPKMYAVSTGTIIRGQSEGSILYGGTHVNVGNGIVYAPGTALPANNHTVTDTHFKAHFRGIQLLDADPSATGGPQGSQSQFTNVYVLEKTTSDPKPNGFIGFEVRGRGITLTACKVWTTNLASNVDVSQSSKTGYLVGRNSVQLTSCFCDGMHYALNVVNYNNAAYNTGAAHITDFNEQHTALSFLAPGSLRPKGTVSGSTTNGDANQSEYIDAEYKYKYADGAKWLMSRYDGWNIYTGATYSYNHKTSSAATNTDSRAVFSGGDTTSNVDNMGSVTFLVNKLWTSATEMGSNSDNVMSVGWPSRRCTTFYGVTGAINTSDGRYKTAVTPLSDVEIACAQALASEIGWYKWLDSEKNKGDAARKHFGTTVQRAIEIFQSFGLDPFEYGAICHDDIAAQEEITTENEDGTTTVVMPAREAFDIYSFRWDELSALIIRGLAAADAARKSELEDAKTALAELSSRVQALEGKGSGGA